ncbi:hypothetical protein QTP88_008000 [Uroleucon formosanum]
MLADELNLKRETVRKILTDDLSMKKLCANMVPKNLLAEQKHVQMSISQDCLEQVEADPTLLDRVITGDESWYFQYDPETKRQSQQWLSPGAARPKKARMSKSNLRSSSNEYVCDQSRPCTSNEQYLDTNDTLVISGMSSDVCDSAFVEKTVINADKNETHNNKCIYYRYIGDFLETPRRRKLFWNTHTKMLDEKNQKKRLLEQKNRRLESKISSLNTLVDELKKECQLNASYSHILKNIGTEEGKQLLMRQLQISTGKSICPILRKFAMTLHFYSPSAYSYVRTIFSKALPDVSTIRKWYSKLDGLPGMTKESFQAISLKVKEMKVNGKQLYGCLVMDEMSIKQHVHWTGTRHQGYIDFGLGGKTEEMDNLPYAKDAFVIMVVDINTSWKVPIAYYLINGISAEEKANIILNCLQELDTTGVIIKTLTFDGAANNLSMASELEANLQYSELKPYFLHPNTNDKKLPWRLEDINESGLHSATKLRNRHIYYFREKMKVRLVVQTFSTSVANAILFCMNDLKLDNFQGADATIEFCLILELIDTEYFSFILTYKFSQDHIEMLFSAIRAKGGFNNNPTVSQFEAAYKSIIVHSEIKSSSSANCMALDDTTILTVPSSNIKVKDTQSELLDLLCVAGTDDLENDNLVSVYQHSNFINDVVACIAGFVVRKIKKKTILCDTCAVEIEVGSSESKLLDRKNRGGLIKPSHDVLQIFQTSNPEAYRTLVHYLRNEKAEFHTFQLKEDKPMRIVIRNLHPSTSTEMIKNELEHRLYEVRQVTQVISKIPLGYKSNNVQDSHPRNTTSCNPPSGHSQTYAQATQGQHLQSDIPPPTPDINSLMSSFSNYDIDEAVNNLTMLIQSATWEATKPNKTHDSKNNYPIVSDQIRCLIVEKRRARAKYQVTRLPSHKTAYNKLANLLKKVLAKYKSFIMNPPAKSSLSPSHIKNTKNNLTIHPIKIVKSNDNTNNWQTVPIRSPSTPTSPNPIIQKTNSFSSKNRFSALATNEISYEISNEVEMLSQEISNVQPKIPPIYIKDDIDFFDFCKKIKPFTDPDGFNTKSSSSGLKLMTYSINAYRQIIKFLEINNMNFHTYQTNEEKAFRVVIRHLHHTTPTDYIKEELHSLGFITRSITNCLQYKTKNPLPLFFVDLEPSPSNHNIYKVDSICYTKIKIEAPHPKKNPVQRLRCQNYGHTRTYCHHTPRCVKRCDIHLSFECQKDSNTPATCALCSGDHPASYKGCPKFKLLQKGRSSIKTNRPTET